MSKNYDWQRFWYKQGDSPHLIEAFLYVNEYIKNVFSLHSVSDTPCLVLLGEPGMGKSREIERNFQTQITNDFNDKLDFNLSSYGDESRLIRDIFESDKIKQWKESNFNLYLFLDSLDEALLNINTLALLLADEIEKLPTERLFLRIACRTAEWSNLSVLENKLKEIWKQDKCQILQIAPLQQKDVESAAQTKGSDSEKFIAEVFNKNVTALASKPVTLQFLLNLFGKNDSFPSTQTELYEKGCLTLCEEKNERRRASKRIGKLTPEQRFVIAARIAALMIFGNKSSIWIGGITGEEEASDILISELSGYSEKRKDNSEFQVTEDDIREVINDTGLFTSNGNNRLKFSHQTFAEFLASWYLEYRELSDETVINLIGEKYLYPQLYETSAWIASRRKTIFQYLIKIEPLVLLRSDVLSAEDYLRAKLTERLLEVFEKEEAKDDVTRGYYSKLKHSNLAEQLRPFINDKTKGWLVKRVAIDIAEACHVQELQDDLLNLVLDKTELHPTRVNAAYAVKRIGDNETKFKLKPFIYGGYGEDENLELKGVAISALWREQLTTKELFDVFIEPPPSFLGSYKSFFYQLSRELQVEDLPITLRWLKKKISETGYLSFEMKNFAEDVIALAWQNLEDKEIFEAYVETILPFLEIHKEGFVNTNDNYDFDKQTLEKRRKVLIQLLPQLNKQKDWLYLNSSPLLRLRFEDFDWLFEEWNQSNNDLVKDRVMMILKDFIVSTQGYFSEGANPDFLDKVYQAIDSNQKFKDEMYVLFEAVELNSELAVKSKERYEEILSWDKKEKDEELLIPTPKERVVNCLNRFENGEIAWWWQMTMREMTLLPTSKYYSDQVGLDITKLPGWNEASLETKDRVIKTAKDYLLLGDPESEKWMGTNSYLFPAIAGLQAIKLLEKYDVYFLDTLNNDIWAKWSNIIYFYPFWNNKQELQNQQQKLVSKLYAIVPDEVIELLKFEINNENKKEENPHISFGKLQLCWDEKLKKVLKDSLVEKKLSDSLINQILTQLFELNDKDVEKLVCNFIKYPIPKDEREQQLLIIGIKLLIQYGKTSCWEKIWSIFTKNSDFGKKVVESGVFRFSRYSIGNLQEQQIADLFIWISTYYPHNEDPDFSGENIAHMVGVREEIGSWRNSLLEYLKNKGTLESVSAIEQIKKELSHLDWLKFTLLDAQENMRLNSWQPLSSKELLEVFCLEEKRKLEKVELKSIASVENIVRKIDMLSEKIEENHNQMMDQFANLVIARVQNEISKLSKEEKEQLKEIKKGKWETKLKFVIPLIPKIPYLGEFFPSASLETTRTIESEEYIDFVRRKLYDENIQINILQEKE